MHGLTTISATDVKKIIVCRQANVIVGFLSVIEEKNHYYFELIGVSCQMQNRGIGSLMLKESLSNFSDKNCICVTQFHNIPMQYLLQKERFRIYQSHFIFTRDRNLLRTHKGSLA